MFGDEVAQILGLAIGYAIHELVRRFMRSSFWRRVSARADRYLEDPEVPADTPERAAELALLDEQRKHVESIATTIRIKRESKGP